MKCDKTSEIVAYLKGEVEEPDREPLRLHFESCPACSKELARFDRTLKALGKIEAVEPSAGFTWRVRQAFAAAHPEFIERRRPQAPSWWDSVKAHFDFIPAWAISVAVHVLLLAIVAIIFFIPKSEQDEFTDAIIQAKPRPTKDSGPEWKGPGRNGSSAIFDPEKEPEPTPDWNKDNPEVNPIPRKYPRDGTQKPLDPRRWMERYKKDRNLAFFAARTDEKLKETYRKTYGGDGVATNLNAALRWLVNKQEADGRWSNGKRDYEIGLTGLALLAFLGEGHTHQKGDFKQAVDKGIQFLLTEQKSNGLIGRPEGHYTYDHAIATLAIMEAWAITRDEQLQAPVSAAVAFTVAAQNSQGGWGYVSRDTASDTSVGGWQILLLRIAFINGDQTVIPALNLARDRVAYMTDSEGKVGYRARLQFPHGYHALTAVGMLSGMFSTLTVDEETLEKQTRLLLEVPPIVSTEPSAYITNDLYFAYFGSLALFQRGGNAWAEWFPIVKKKLLEGQQKDGSWPAGFDKWSGYGGSVYTTAMSVLVLETPWRYPRLAE